MESDWRFNVWLWGMSGSAYDMIAHAVGGGGALYVGRKKVFDGTFSLLVPASVNGPLNVLTSPLIPPLTPSFPYGINVFPDS